MLFRIADYATTATDESVYIIGGYTYGAPEYLSIIAKYGDDKWTNVGSLKKGRKSHGAIIIEGTTMIIGGWHGSSGST